MPLTEIKTRSKSNSPNRIRSPEVSPMKTPVRNNSNSNKNNNHDNKNINKDDTDILSLLTSNSFIMLLLLVFLVRIIVMCNEEYSFINIAPHENKKYSTFEEFLPFYKTQHTNEYSCMLHFIGTSIFLIVAITDLKIIVSYLLAMIMGLNIHPLTKQSSHGLIEALAMFSTYLISVHILSGKRSKAAGAVMIAYACAWIGHFFLEKNRPATFMYPTYSLLGDLVLWRDVLTNLVISAIPPPPNSDSSMKRFLLNFTFRF